VKLLKIKIKRTEGNGVTSYSYPTPFYQAEKVIFGPIYEGGEEDLIKIIRDRKSNYEHILIGLKDEDSEYFLSGNRLARDGFTFEVEEVSKENAIEFASTWVKSREVVIDQDAVLSVLAKNARGENLTESDLKVIDPDDPTGGIIRTKNLVELLDEFIKK